MVLNRDRTSISFDEWMNDVDVSTGSVRGAKRVNRSRYSSRERAFVVWDGEGVTVNDDEPQRYVLLGNSASKETPLVGENLRTLDMLDYIMAEGIKHPTAIHVGFAFEYDTNMILRDLAESDFQTLMDTGVCKWNGYRIEHIPHKWLMISRNGTSVKIADIFGFYQCSFVKAVENNIPADDPIMSTLDTVKAGKDQRQAFALDQMDYIIRYWTLEIDLAFRLVSELRKLLHGAGFNINQWHGPGALANYTYKLNGIEAHKQECPPEVNEAARYAYAGGRFEHYSLGRHTGPVFGLDINSAYPAAIAKLPSLSPDRGTWRHHNAPRWNADTLPEFAVCRVVLDESPFMHYEVSPFFNRNAQGFISYPLKTSGWYWSPEVREALVDFDYPNLRIVEAWEWEHDGTYPFAEFVPNYYTERQRMKAAKIGAEKALKLVLNSLYGKMAQRTGWERTGNAPKWHQLEWAGWVTSWTRSKLYALMADIPQEHLIAVETDGLYTSLNPDELGIKHSKLLGEWEVTQYDELLYLQSGMYFALDAEGTWGHKYRGLDAGSITLGQVQSYLRTSFPWIGEYPANLATRPLDTLIGSTTRFRGYRAAMMTRGGIAASHNRWETGPKGIGVGGIGKRQHMRGCPVCKERLTPWEKPHPLMVASTVYSRGRDSQSYPHDIPWIDAAASWRVTQQREQELIHAY